MNIELFPIIMFAIGIISTVFGFNLLFKQGFVERLRQGLWKSGNDGMYIYDKYIRGISCFLIGLLFLGFSIYILFFLK